MWISANNKTKSYQIYWKIALLFIFLYQILILQPLQPQVFPIGIMMMEALVWLHVNHGESFDGMRLVIISLAINLTFISLINLWRNLFYF